MRPPRPPGTPTAGAPDPALAGEAARQLERMNAALATLRDIGNSQGARQLQGQLQDFARGLMGMRTLMQAAGGQMMAQTRLIERQQVAARALATSTRVQTEQYDRFLRSLDRAASRRDRTPIQTERQVGANLSRRAREASEVLQIETLQTRTQATGLKKTIAQEARGEAILQNTPGDKADIARAARDLERSRLAQRIQAQLESGLQDAVAANMLRNASAETGLGGHQRELLTSGYDSLTQHNRRAIEEAGLARDLEAGGAGQQFHGRDDTEALRARQGEAYASDVHRQRVEEIRDTQRLLFYEQQRQQVLASPEALAILRQEMELKARMAQVTAEIAGAEARRRRSGAVPALGDAHLAQHAQRGEERLETLQQSVNLERSRVRYLASPEGRRGLQDEVRLRRELERSQQASRFLEVAGTDGRAIAYLDAAGNRIKGVNENLRAMASLGSSAFAAISAGAVGLTSVADPMLSFPTFTESLRAMGIELGSLAAGPLVELAGNLQGAARWVRELSDGFKTNTARVLIWVAAGGAALLTIRKIIVGLEAMQLALAGTMMFARAHPVVAALSLIGVAVSALGAEYVLMGKNASAAARAVGSVGDAAIGRARAKTVTPEMLRALKPEDREALIRAAEGKRGQAAEDAFRGSLLERQGLVNRQMATVRAAQIRDIPGLDELEKIRDEFIQRRTALHKKHFGTTPDERNLAGTKMEGGALQGLVNPRTTINRALFQGRFDRDSKDLQDEMNEKLAGVFKRLRITDRPSILALAGGTEAGGLGALLKKTREPLAELEERRSSLRKMSQTLGVDEGMSTAYRGPQPQIMDAAGYGDKLTLAALKGNDLESQNWARQLELLERIESNTSKGGGGGGGETVAKPDVVLPKKR